MKNRGYRFKPYDKPTTSFGQTWQPGNKSYNYKRPFLGHSQAISQAMSFQAGQVRHFIQNWAILTSDPFILNAVKHYHIEFDGDFPVQTQKPNQIRFSAEETQIIDSEILKYLSKRVIEPA
jgi:hypothetical protein